MNSPEIAAQVRNQHRPLPRYEGPQAWYGPDMALRRDEWLRAWTGPELAEIEAAVARVLERDLEILEIGREQFPLPTLEPVLHEIRRQVLHGRGFVLLRGLPVERWSVRQAAIAYWGIGAHLGEACSQNAQGHVLGHVKDLGRDYHDPLARGYQTNARLPYHTDSTDIVGLLCWRPGKAGGLSSIVSSTTVYNEMAARRPDLAQVLMGSFHRTRWGEVAEGRNPWSEMPVFMPTDSRMIVSYVRSAITKGQKIPGVPKLTDRQVEALDMMDALAEDPELYLDMEFKSGDIQLLCNHSILHSRTAFEDWPEPDRRRHLLRLWLSCADGPALPEAIMRREQDQSASGRPSGIRLPGVALKAPLEAE